jgi:hypothetical protein
MQIFLDDHDQSSSIINIVKKPGMYCIHWPQLERLLFQFLSDCFEFSENLAKEFVIGHHGPHIFFRSL